MAILVHGWKETNLGHELTSEKIVIWRKFTGSNQKKNLSNREGQSDSTPVDKYNFILTIKSVGCYSKNQSNRAL